LGRVTSAGDLRAGYSKKQHTVSALDDALYIAEQLGPIIPLHTPVEVSKLNPSGCDCHRQHSEHDIGKHPRVERGLKDATRDEAKVRYWWDIYPTANVGLDLASANLLDVAPDSPEWQATFAERGLAATLSFTSGGGDGHTHYLYRREAGDPVKRLCRSEQFDIMSNGYSVVPNSLHKSGRHYTWLSSPDTPIASSRHVSWAVDMLRVSERAVVDMGDMMAVAPAESSEPPVALDPIDAEIWNTAPTSDRSGWLWVIAKILVRHGLTDAAIQASVRERDLALPTPKYVARGDRDRRYAELVTNARADVALELPRVGNRQRTRADIRAEVHYA
jgi:hypothetical protein